MSEREFDALLGRALLGAALADGAESLARTAEPPFSPRYLRERLRLLADPFGWRRRRERPAWKRALRGVACLLLVCALSLAAVLTLSPTARARVWQWVMERYETHTNYRFSGEAAHGSMPQYEVSVLPEGYEEIERETEPAAEFVAYENEAGQRIYLSYMQMQQGNLMALSMENMQMKTVLVNGLSGEFYLSSDPLQSHTVFWRDEAQNLAFSLDAHGEEQNILYMAESVSLVK